MSIRIGSSCVLSQSMAIGKVVETRRFMNYNLSDWQGISSKCIQEKIYLIVTICLDKNGKLEKLPSELEWRNTIDDTVKKLTYMGANKNCCRIDLVNEPCKYIHKEQYANLINIAYDQVKGRLPVGAGCDELIYGDMYQYISSHANFDVLVVHIQGACNNELNTSNLTNFALNLATSYKRLVDCNESNYFSVNTDSGYKGLLMNLKYAEKIGCKNFPIVFINLDKSAFAVNTDRWERLSFFVNGSIHSSYWNDFSKLIEAKCPIPNIIPLPIIEDENFMKLKDLKIGSKGNQVRFLQEILMIEYSFPNEYENPFDGKFGNLTDKQVRAYQTANNLKVDGYVGINTMTSLILDINKKPVEDRKFSTDYWFKKLQIYMAYE